MIFPHLQGQITFFVAHIKHKTRMKFILKAKTLSAIIFRTGLGTPTFRSIWGRESIHNVFISIFPTLLYILKILQLTLFLKVSLSLSEIFLFLAYSLDFLLNMDPDSLLFLLLLNSYFQYFLGTELPQFIKLIINELPRPVF